jgi:hypothetical protein
LLVAAWAIPGVATIAATIFPDPRLRAEEMRRRAPFVAGHVPVGRGVLFSTQSFERFEITVREPCTIAAISDRQSEVWRLRADFENPLVSPAKLTW